MKKLSLIILAILFVLVGCSEESSSDKQSNTEQAKPADSSKESELSFEEKQQEIVNFINEDMNEIATYETKANEALATVSGENFKNDEELLTVLTNEVIPEYEKAVEKAKSLDVKVEELKPIVAQIEEATGIYHEALLLEKEALEKSDKALIEQSNAKGDEYVQAIAAYHEEMKKLTSEYDIDYKQD
ncbi:hypothetical protein [Metabacillus iocasae]|uniref:PBP1b-binding outer membrane lipoprotein LpoB n=1 Tax=Priestia iocasae TaxID=2291674 RepID=A0ABS2QY38_9BACI|nr:hypothetical protein [Metabacillus iocasae]MBM7704399.1 PBP1b-binding outer membrane lipoprotein LpoB [Metabacillus iocasae]